MVTPKDILDINTKFFLLNIYSVRDYKWLCVHAACEVNGILISSLQAMSERVQPQGQEDNRKWPKVYERLWPI